jgi:hypothetical protein
MPLTISVAELDEGLDCLEKALADEFGSSVAWSPRRPEPEVVAEAA